MKKQSKDNLSLQWFVSHDSVILQAKRKAKKRLNQYKKHKNLQDKQYSLTLCQDEIAIEMGYQNWFDLQHQRKKENEKTIFPEFMQNFRKQASLCFEEIMADCWQKKVDHIHFEIRNDSQRVRIRQYGNLSEYHPQISLPVDVDGLLKTVFQYYWNATIEDIPVAAKEIVIKSFNSLHNAQEINLKLRFQYIPCYPSGYDMVIKLYDDKHIGMDITKLGYNKEQIESLNEMVASKEKGLIVISGHVGSGMNTTLKTLLQENNRMNKNNLDNTQWVTLSEEKIGEAEKYLEQGQRVLTSLHSANTIQTLERLIDLGLSKELVEKNMNTLINQKLIPVLCDHCKIPFKLARKSNHRNHAMYNKLSQKFSEEQIEKMFIQGNGCHKCNHLGYQGKTICATIISKEKMSPVSIRNVANEKILLGQLSPVDVEEKIGFD